MNKQGQFWLAKKLQNDINFELLKVIKMNSLKIYITQAMKKLETSNLDIR